MARPNAWLSALVALVVAAGLAVPAHADPASCQKQIVRGLLKFKRAYLLRHFKCVQGENIGKVSGPCPDTTALLKIQLINQKAVTKIAASCTPADLAALNYRTDCQYEAATAGKEGVCAAKTVTVGTDIDPTNFAECLKCWKGAELSEYVAILFASHASELCGSLNETSATCSDINCTSPLPDQRNLGDTGENDCQFSIAKGGIKYLVKREQILEKCALGRGTVPPRSRAQCLADLKLQLALQKADDQKQTTIKKKCGNRAPAANPPFCCRTGTGQNCTVVATRADCEAITGAQVQADKTCDSGTLMCQPITGPNGKKITWWENCPESDTCPGTALTSLDDLIGCVDTTANAIADELLCLQFRGNGGADWPCPPGEGT